MDTLREQMFILIILKLFQRYNNPSAVFNWLQATCTMTGLDNDTMLRLTLRIMREEHNIRNLEHHVCVALYKHGAKINDIMSITGKAESTCYKFLKRRERSYTKRFETEDDKFILEALKIFKTLGGEWY